MVPSSPFDIATSTLPEVMTCKVCPPPSVKKNSTSRPAFLSMPSFWANSRNDESQKPRCEIATLSLSCACAAEAKTPARTAEAATAATNVRLSIVSSHVLSAKTAANRHPATTGNIATGTG